VHYGKSEKQPLPTRIRRLHDFDSHQEASIKEHSQKKKRVLYQLGGGEDFGTEIDLVRFIQKRDHRVRSNTIGGISFSG